MSDAPRGRIVNRETLAMLLAIDPRTLDGWVRRGCPIRSRGGRGRAHEFESGAVIEWHLAHSEERRRKARSVVSLDEARQRLTTASALLAELELARVRESLVPIDLVAVVGGALFGAVASRLEAIPAEVADLVAGHRSAAKVRRALEDEFARVLEELVTQPALAEAACGT